MDRKSLLVQPRFPMANKSKNHSSLLPIGLLKLATYLRYTKGELVDEASLVWGEQPVGFEPSTIYVTSLYTYWSEYVRDCVRYYRAEFPKARIYVGGILATLMPDLTKSFARGVRVHSGLHEGAERDALRYGAAYDLVDRCGVDYQIVHAMRGCVRRCEFCGTWRLEKRADVVVDELMANIELCGTKGRVGRNPRNKLVFYDNNLLANSHVDELLERLSALRLNGRRVTCESQSGFDGRIMRQRPELATLIKNANFKVPRIAWDGPYSDVDDIECQIDLLVAAGYSSREVFVFFLYNWDVPYEDMYRKVERLWEWQVQISDCRFRPLNQTHDHFNPRKWRVGQTGNDYHIHAGWSDRKVRALRKIVRWQAQRLHGICGQLHPRA